MECLAGESQIKAPGETFTTLLVSSSYCCVDQSDPITTETMRGRKKQRLQQLVKICMILPFLLPTHLFFIPLPHKACFAKHFQSSSTVESPESFYGIRAQLSLGRSSLTSRFFFSQEFFFSDMDQLQLLKLSSPEYFFLIYHPWKNTVKIMLKV